MEIALAKQSLREGPALDRDRDTPPADKALLIACPFFRQPPYVGLRHDLQVIEWVPGSVGRAFLLGVRDVLWSGSRRTERCGCGATVFLSAHRGPPWGAKRRFVISGSGGALGRELQGKGRYGRSVHRSCGREADNAHGGDLPRGKILRPDRGDHG